jgi:hypothetical protein
MLSVCSVGVLKANANPPPMARMTMKISDAKELVDRMMIASKSEMPFRAKQKKPTRLNTSGVQLRRLTRKRVSRPAAGLPFI